MSLVMGALVPHPPIIIPEVGGREVEKVSHTINAMENLSRMIREANTKTVAIITPHNLVFRDAVGILVDDLLTGSLASFGAPQVRFQIENDKMLVKLIQEECLSHNFPLIEIGEKFRYRYGMVEVLDHASMVPLYYILQENKDIKVVIMTMAFMPYRRLFEFGKILQKAISRHDTPTALVASGDLSHRLIPGAPAGYDPMGKVFDEKIVEIMKNFDRDMLFKLDKSLIERAGECGFRPIVMLFGTFEGIDVKTDVLSYEGPFGVGYCVTAIRPEVKE